MQVDEYAEIGPRLEFDNLYVNLKISHFSHQQKSRSFARHGQILGHWQTHWMLRQWHIQAFENLCQNTCSMCATGTHGGSVKMFQIERHALTDSEVTVSQFCWLANWRSLPIYLSDCTIHTYINRSLAKSIFTLDVLAYYLSIRRHRIFRMITWVIDPPTPKDSLDKAEDATRSFILISWNRSGFHT